VSDPIGVPSRARRDSASRASRRLLLARAATFLTVAGAVGIVLWQFDPRLLFSSTTDTGGDTGAHVMLPAFLLHHLLPHLRLTGWDPGWYDGFPLYTFYFPLPDLATAIVAGLHLVSYDVAFKVSTALGSLALPPAAYLLGRSFGLERPRPAFLAAATLPFLFDQTWTIYGGNLYSTLAGEYSYSLGLALALVAIGLTASGLRTGRHRALAAVAFAATLLAHLVAAFFAAAGALVVLLLVGPSVRRVRFVATVGATAALLTAWWALPFVAEQAYTTDMGWRNIRTYASSLAPTADRWALVLAAVGVLVALKRALRGGNRLPLALALLGAGAAAGFVLDPQGKLYNARLLPLWWLAVDLLAGLGAAEVLVGIVRARRWFAARRAARAASALEAALGQPGAAAWLMTRAPWRQPVPRLGVVLMPLAALVSAAGIVLPPLVLPAGASGPVVGPLHVAASNVPSWVRWNETGYQGKSGWPEYRAVIALVASVARRYGCGRVMWEYSPSLNRFGTTMSLMLLPYWTHGCVDSMEGLLFESSATTPYHFLDQAELSLQPSEAMVGLPYGADPLDVPLGVEHLQLLGVRYFLASSPAVEALARADPSLELVGSTGPWRTEYEGTELSTTWDLFYVRGASLVAPLADEPAVLEGVGQGQSSWLPVAIRWFLHPAAWSVALAAGGPPSWQRIRPGQRPVARPLPPVRVSDVAAGTDWVRFRVSRPGVPVLVKVSYFPAWHVTGAIGPWRVTPNLMVVVPTRRTVVLHYSTTGAERAGDALSGLGVVALGVLVRRRRLLMIP
jgi:hypothetical protein